MQILGLFGMYFDAAEVEAEKYFFFQIGSGHTVGYAGKIVSFLVKRDVVAKHLHPTQI